MKADGEERHRDGEKRKSNVPRRQQQQACQAKDACTDVSGRKPNGKKGTLTNRRLQDTSFSFSLIPYRTTCCVIADVSTLCLRIATI